MQYVNYVLYAFSFKDLPSNFYVNTFIFRFMYLERTPTGCILSFFVCFEIAHEFSQTAAIYIQDRVFAKI